MRFSLLRLVLEPIRIMSFVFLPLSFIGPGRVEEVPRKRVERRNCWILFFSRVFVQNRRHIVLQTLPSHHETGFFEDRVAEQFAFRFGEQRLKGMTKAPGIDFPQQGLERFGLSTIHGAYR